MHQINLSCIQLVYYLLSSKVEEWVSVSGVMNPVGSQVDPLAFVTLDKYSTPDSVAGLQQHEIHPAFLKLVSKVWSMARLFRLFTSRKAAGQVEALVKRRKKGLMDLS